MKKPDIIKLSEFSATTLSTLSDNTSAYIPAFISDVENYKIPVDNFIAEEMNSWKEWSEDRNSSGSNTSVYIGPNNKADASAAYIMGQNNMSTSDCNTNTIIGFDNTQNNTSNAHIFGENNTVTSGVENTVIGMDNRIDTANDTSIFGLNNTVSASDINNIIGLDNTLDSTSGSSIIGEKNTATSARQTIVLGISNSADITYGSNIIGKDNLTNNYYNSSIIGLENSANGSDTSIIGKENNINGSENNIIGAKNTLSESYTNNLFGIDNSASNYTTISDIIGHSNKSTGGHNSTVVGEFNTLDGATRTYIFGNNISAHGTWDFAAIGENNSCESSTTNTVIGYENRIEGCYGNGVIGQKNILIDSYDMYILGQNNKAQNRSVYSIIVGQENETSGTDGRGQYIFGCRNKVSGGYVIGMSNSADNGGMAFGVSNNVHNGAYAIGDYNWSDQGSLTLAPACGENSANRGSIAIGWGFNNHSNSADLGSIAIGKNTYANDGAFTFGEELSANQGSISIGRTVSAGHGSITIGFDGASAENGSFTIGKYGASAYNGSYIIGESSSASNGSIVFGKYGAMADGSSISMGWNGIGASGNSITIGHDGVYSYGLNSMAIGLSGVSADHSSIVFGMNSVSAASAGMAIGAQGVTANDNTFAIGYRGVGASGAPSFAIGSQGVYAFDNGFTIGVNSISAANYSFAIGRESVSARNTSISIGMNGNFAENYGVALGVSNSAYNHSIMLGTNGSPSYAQYGSIGIHAGDSNKPFTADNYSIAIRSTYDEGVVTTNYGGISIGRSEGYTYVNNDSIAIGKLDAYISDTGLSPSPTNILSADNFSIAIGKAGFHPMMVNNQSTFIGNSTNASAYATNMSYVIGIAGGHYYPGSSQYGTGILSADNRSLIFGGSMNTSTIVEHDSVSIGFDNIGYYGAMMFGDSNSAYNHYSGNSPSSTWTNAYILGDFNRVENYRGILSNGEEDNKNSRTIDGIARTMSLVVGNDNKVIGYNAFSFGSQNMNGMYEYAWNGSSYSSDKADDGFTFTFGLLNYAARNYDMAIGYSSIASGGENIAIGGPIYSMTAYGWAEPGAPTQASGYKNISIRSRLDGIENIGIDSWNITRNNGDIGNFTKNRFDNSTNISFNPAVPGSWNMGTAHKNYMSFCNGINLVGTVDSIGITNNILYKIENATFVASQNISDNYMFNIGGHDLSATTMSAKDISCNVFYHTSANGNYEYMAHNIFVDSFIDSTYGKNDSHVLDSIMYRSWTKLGTPFTYTGGTVSNFNDYAHIHNSVLFGTVTEGSVEDTFSFGALNDIWGNPLNYGEPPLLRHVSHSVNFGDNYIFNAIDTRVIGMQNSAYNAGSTTVIGRTNYIDPKWAHGNDRVTVNNSEVIHDLSIIGTSNTVIENTDRQILSEQTRGNSILGSNNVINISADMEDNTVIGSTNRMCKVPQGIQDAVWYSSPFNFIVQNEYQSLVPTKDEYIRPGESWTTLAWSGIDYAYIYSGFQSYSSDRNTIIGTHSVITPCVDDSLVLGNNNAAYNSMPDGTIRYSNIVAIGSYNVGVDGSNQFVAGFNNVASGHHSTAIGEELRSNEFQTVMGKYNIPLAGTVRTTSAWDYTNNSAYAVENSGTLFVIGNGRVAAYEKINSYGDSTWYNSNNEAISYYDVCSPAYIERSNAMIVSANGMVSAANFATSGYGDVESTLDALNIATYENAQNINILSASFDDLSATTYENTQNINDISAAIGDIETLLAAL